jgi:misacylated tRNA(Ala) deacylase
VDLSLPGFAREQVTVMEAEVNEVLRRGLRVIPGDVPEAELESRPELVRTFKVRPPVIDGRVRVVEIEGFDAQACGGTHVHSTREIGQARVTRFENQGKNNKRFYWELAP